MTALFADIKGSTELIRALDPEEARALVDPVLRLMIEAVHRYDGDVAQSTGDGIFALFGAPLAHEDHPRVRETRRRSLTAGDRRRSPPHRTAPGDVQKRSYSRPSPEGLLERRERLDLTDLFGIGATCKMYGTLYRLAPMENSFGCDTVGCDLHHVRPFVARAYEVPHLSTDDPFRILRIRIFWRQMQRNDYFL